MLVLALSTDVGIEDLMKREINLLTSAHLALWVLPCVGRQEMIVQ